MRPNPWFVAAGLAVVIAAAALQTGRPRAAPPVQIPQPAVYAQQCSQTNPGAVKVVLIWTPSGQGQQWLDLSLFNNGFAPGTFVGVGPLSPDSWVFIWDGLLSGRTHYIRVNTLTASGWQPTATTAFVTGACEAPVATLGTVTQQCSSLHPGRVKATFNWTPAASTATTQYVDLSIFNNAFAPGTFIGAGPLPGGTRSFVWDGLLPGTTHYWRVNTLTGSGWESSATGSFTTSLCDLASITPALTPTPLPDTVPTTSLSLQLRPGEQVCRTTSFGVCGTGLSYDSTLFQEPPFLTYQTRGISDVFDPSGHCSRELTFCLSASSSAPPGIHSVHVLYTFFRYPLSESRVGGRALRLTVTVVGA